ncbi:MAG: class I SAM-dependent methyltransferase [Kiritimatiellales bacterium]|nr:class I SAM-dependent methyltransferase [Kiritimatiellales bacterium]
MPSNNPYQKRCCPLCGAEENKLFHCDRRREYFQCLECALVFVPPEYHLPAAEEKARYDLHENSAADSGYVQWLEKLFQPLEKELKPGVEGIDFGCGPGPVLSQLFRDAGYPCVDYDPFYANDPALLERQYDFLACSEVIEHCGNPRKEIELFLKLVKPGGVIGIMTQLVRNREAFATWYYIDDLTHVCFFCPETFQWLEKKYRIRAAPRENSVTLLFV